MWIEREISKKITLQAGFKPSILVTGARQTGKSSLLSHLFAKAHYVSFDRPLIAEEAETNPEAFLAKLPEPAILDEIQYVPSLFRELKVRIDEKRELNGRYLLTGSQKFLLMQGVSESLAGRLSIFELDTLSAAELRAAGLDQSDLVQRGGYPELWVKRDQPSQQFFDDYIATYLERDLKALINVSSLRTFDRFMQMAALRVGSLLNLTELAKDVGVSPNTIKHWVEALEASGIVFILPPYFSNQTKRLVKTPKLYFRDNGLLCHLLRIYQPQYWEKHVLASKVWENFVCCELLRYANSEGSPRHLFFWREKSGKEVDFVYEAPQYTHLIECKLGERINAQELNFGLFEAMHPKVRVQKCAALPIQDSPRHLASGVVAFNPLWSPFPWQTQK